MTEIIGVRFKDGGKVYYFNPNGVPVEVGQHVIIETSKGIEFGECALANTMVDEMELIAALRPMLRIATEEDMQRVEANHRNEKRAFAICQEKILEHKLEMKLVEVKYSFDGSKILFFFTAHVLPQIRAGRLRGPAQGHTQAGVSGGDPRRRGRGQSDPAVAGAGAGGAGPGSGHAQAVPQVGD